jgi:shikimate dehydrogenase
MKQPAFRLGLIGYPLGHSLSPRLHRVALAACHLDGDYRLYPIPPGTERLDQLHTLLEQLRQDELHGLNVTIPLKQEVLPLLDNLAPAAQAIGAVNTIYSQEGRLVGDNTDAPAFLADLEEVFPGLGIPEHPALVLGAGGAARAVTYALLQSGWQVVVAARRLEQARELIQSFCPSKDIRQLSAICLDRAAIEAQAPGISLIVNTTPAGMTPHEADSPWPEDLPFPDGAFVYDLVYNPAQTRLVREARQAGLPAANGMGMLVEQAALAFERWTGQVPPRQAMRYSMNSFGG